MNRTLKDDLDLARRAAREAIAQKYLDEGAANTAANIREGRYDNADARHGQSPELVAAFRGAEATVRTMWRAELLVYVRDALRNALDVPSHLKEAQAAEFRAMSDADLAEDLADKDSDVRDWLNSYGDTENGLGVLLSVIAELRKERLIP